MLAIERRQEILARLTRDGKVIVNELARNFSVTEETIRRDLDRLDKEGLVSKTYGGAVSKHNATIDLPYSIRESANIPQKQLIADRIAEMIRDGERLMLDSSSTALYIVKQLKDKKNLTLITNSVKILIEVADRSDWTVLSTGGMLKKGGLALNGSSAETMIRSYYVDTAICSCKGVDLNLGVTDSNEQDSLIKKAMFACADRNILALDSEKFDKKSFVKVCELSDVDLLVTDRDPGEKWKSFCKNRDIKMIYDKV